MAVEYRCPSCKRKYSVKSRAADCCRSSGHRVEESSDGFLTFHLATVYAGSSGHYGGYSDSCGGGSYGGGDSGGSCGGGE